jgi:hypothetical protein
VALPTGDLDDAEIHQERLVVHVQHDVGRLDIPVDQVVAVSVFCRLANLQADAQAFGERQMASGSMHPPQAVKTCSGAVSTPSQG